MRTTFPTRRRRVSAVALISAVALSAAACSDKKDENVDAGTTAATAATATTTAPVTTVSPPTTEGTALATTTAPATTAAPETTVPAPTPVPGGRIVIAGEAEVGNPWTPKDMQCDSYCQMRARTFFEPLATADEDLVIHPYVAEVITPNGDFTEWTIKLRDGITFHDGEVLNADAAIKSLTVAATGLVPSNYLRDLAKIDGVLKTAKVDDLTFTLFTGKNGDPAQPVSWPGFERYLTANWTFLASPKWLDAVAADPNQATKPIGTGPFQLTSFAPGDRLVVKKNPDYWNTDADGVQLPYLDEIEFRIIADEQTRQQALEAGDLDMMTTDSGVVVADLRTKQDEYPSIEYSEYGETFYILLHLTQPPLDDRRIRCAMTQAIDKTELIDLTGGGVLTPANGPFSPGQEGFLEDNGSLPYDPAAAKALVDDYVAETGQKPKIVYSAVPDANALASAQYYQRVWGEAGIDVEIKTVEQSTLITNAALGSPDFQAFGWRNHAGVGVDEQYHWWDGTTAPPDGALALNFGRLNDPVINDLLANQRTEIDPDVRRGYAEEINRQFAKECWLIPTSWTIWMVAQDGSIQGIGTLQQPDDSGTLVRDGAGFPGQIWLPTVWVEQ